MQSTARRRKELSPGFILFLCLLTTVGGCLSARGNGLPNAFYFPVGVIFAPILTVWIGRRVEKAKTIQLLCILNGGLLCFLIAYQSSRLAPEKIFTHIFGEPRPISLTAMEGRKQYWDGFIWLLSAEISNEDLQQLIDRMQLKMKTTDMSADQIWARHVQIWSAMAWDHWPRTPPTQQLTVYRAQSTDAKGRLRDLTVLRENGGRRIWVILLDNWG